MKKTKLFSYVLVAGLSLVFSCSSEDENINFDEANKADSHVLMSNEKFSCSEISETKSGEERILIKVYDLPDVDIFFQMNDDVDADEYPYKSVFYKDDKELFVFYSNVVEEENGYLLSYSCSYGDMGQIFLPKQLSRGWGEDTMDCLSKAYSNHGWASVWVFVQTAFIPETAVALAAVCAVKNYQP